MGCIPLHPWGSRNAPQKRRFTPQFSSHNQLLLISPEFTLSLCLLGSGTFPGATSAALPWMRVRGGAVRVGQPPWGQPPRTGPCFVPLPFVLQKSSVLSDTFWQP